MNNKQMTLWLTLLSLLLIRLLQQNLGFHFLKFLFRPLQTVNCAISDNKLCRNILIPVGGDGSLTHPVISFLRCVQFIPRIVRRNQQTLNKQKLILQADIQGSWHDFDIMGYLSRSNCVLQRSSGAEHKCAEHPLCNNMLLGEWNINLSNILPFKKTGCFGTLFFLTNWFSPYFFLSRNVTSRHVTVYY